jgi:hypothetical protein
MVLNFRALGQLFVASLLAELKHPKTEKLARS